MVYCLFVAKSVSYKTADIQSFEDESDDDGLEAFAEGQSHRLKLRANVLNAAPDEGAEPLVQSASKDTKAKRRRRRDASLPGAVPATPADDLLQPTANKGRQPGHTRISSSGRYLAATATSNDTRLLAFPQEHVVDTDISADHKSTRGKFNHTMTSPSR